jgi:hypothetical protein
MDVVILILSVVLPLLPIVLFPTRFFGRGRAMTVLGAVLLVGMMMLIWWSLNGLTADDARPGTDTAALTGLSDADLSALEKLF